MMEEESWRSNHGEGTMEEPWRRNRGGGIMEDSGRHLGGILEASTLGFPPLVQYLSRQILKPIFFDFLSTVDGFGTLF